jgi:alpha-beta hydrolase superfamily lysophospholipase
MVHGAGGGAWEWLIWQRVFAAAGAHTQAFDLMPPDPNAALAQTHYSHYLAQVQSQIAMYQPSVLIGASLGGLLAAEAVSVSPSSSVRALVLAAPMLKSGVNDVGLTLPVKQWAHATELAKTARALPDADAAAVAYAHARWRDESASVLNTAYAGRDFASPTTATLMLIAENDRDVPDAGLRAWASAEHMDVQTVRGASHAGLLLGRSAASTAELVHRWAVVACLT